MYPISLFKYSNINAKLKGMYAKKLKRNDFEELTNQKDLKSVIFILKMKNPELSMLSETSKRIQIETELDKIVISDIIKINRLLNKNDKKIFMMFIEKYKLRCIKSAFRTIYSPNVLHEVENNIKLWTNSIFKDIAGIENAKDIDEFKEFIKNTRYSSVFNDIENNIELFEIENKLDKIYFENLLNTLEKDRGSLKELVKQKVKLTNFLWIYRIKKYYKVKDNDLKKIIITPNKLLNMEKFIYVDSEQELLERLKKLHYINKLDSNIQLEISFNKYWYKFNKKIFNNGSFDIGAICAYINLVELENMDIVHIIEAIRYKISKDELKEKLVIE